VKYIVGWQRRYAAVVVKRSAGSMVKLPSVSGCNGGIFVERRCVHKD